MTGAKRTDEGYVYRGYRIECDRGVSKGYYGRWVVSSPSGIKRLFATETLRDAKARVDRHLKEKEERAMGDARRLAADEAFALYDMGDMEVKDTGTWQQDGDEWSMPVFMENGDEPSTKLTFVVRFEAGKAEVTESYFAG